jgi:hypothetical protein
MSASDDLSASLDTLSLFSESSVPSLLSPSAETNTFTLLCSDGSHISVDPSLLSSTSSVFRDVFAAGSGEKSCAVSETKEEIEMLVEALSDDRAPKNEGEMVWLWEMMEKYDVPSLRIPLIIEAR